MTDTMKTELKPCPFCGAPAEIDMDDEQPLMVAVVCTDCQARTWEWGDEAEAIDAWNRRAALAPMKTEQRREALIEKLVDAAHSEGYAERGEQWPMQPYYDRTHAARTELSNYLAALDSQAAQAQPIQGLRVLNALEILERAALGVESPGTAADFLRCLDEGAMLVIENPWLAASPSHSKEPPSDGVQTSKGPSVTNSTAIEFAVVLTGDQQHALRQTLDYLRDQEGKSHQGYFYTGWAGARLREAIDSTHSKEPGECGTICQRDGFCPTGICLNATEGKDGALAAHAIEELHQLGYTVRDGQLIPPDNLGELARVAGVSFDVKGGDA